MPELFIDDKRSKPDFHLSRHAAESATSGTRVSRISQARGTRYLAFYASGNWLLTIAEDSQAVQVWDVPGGNLKAQLPHEDDIRGIRFGPKDGVLGTLSAGLVYVWNLPTGELITQLASAGRVVDFKRLTRNLS